MNTSKILKQVITEVETKDGGILRIGDTVIHTKPTGNTYRTPSIIESFEVCNKGIIRAKTDFKHNSGSKPPAGIDINKLELVIDTFKLPDSWYIQITPENRKLIMVWSYMKMDRGHYSHNINAYYGINNGIYQGNGNLNMIQGVEITFEQFKKHVFNL